MCFYVQIELEREGYLIEVCLSIIRRRIKRIKTNYIRRRGRNMTMRIVLKKHDRCFQLSEHRVVREVKRKNSENKTSISCARVIINICLLRHSFSIQRQRRFRYNTL